MSDVIRDVTLFSLTQSNINPLVAHCNTVLALLAYMRHGSPSAEAEVVTRDVGEALAQLEQQLAQLETYDEVAKRSTRYCLCAMADTVLKDSHFLERYFSAKYERRHLYSMALRLLRQPVQYREVLELIYLCLNLELDQSQDDGDLPFHAMRQDVLKKIREAFVDDWVEKGSLQEMATMHRVHKPFLVDIEVPVWPIYGLTVLALVSVYWVFNRDLIERLESIFVQSSSFVF